METKEPFNESDESRDFSGREGSENNYRREGDYEDRPRYSSRWNGDEDGERRPYNGDNSRQYHRSENGERRPRIVRYNNDGGSYNRENNGDRPRFNHYNNNGGNAERPRYNSYNNNGEQRPRYNSYNNGEQRPRFNRYNSEDGGEQQRPRFNRYNSDQQDGGYSPRPRYNRDGDSQRVYSSDNGEGEQRQYRPRVNRPMGQRPRINRSNGNRPNGGFNNHGGNQNRPRPNSNNRNNFKGGNKNFKAKKPMFMKPRINMPEGIFNEDVEFETPEVAAQQVQLPLERLRLNRYIAMAGVTSRREADELIKAGKIKVNGEVVTEMGVMVDKNAKVEYDGQVLVAERKVYVLLNKPKDCVTTTDDPEERRTVMDLVSDACEERIYPVGRLDRNTTGVILLTNDGDLTEHLTHPKFEVRKIYHVFLDRNVEEEDMKKMLAGIELEDGEIKVDEVCYVDPSDRSQVGVQIHSGRNRIVRRIFESLGYDVEKLDRVYFAGLTKLGIPRGHWRYLNDMEINKLKAGFIK